MGYNNLLTVTKKAICRKIFTGQPALIFHAETEAEQVDVLQKIIQAFQKNQDIRCGEIVIQPHYGVRLKIELAYLLSFSQTVDCRFHFDKNNDLSVTIDKEYHHLHYHLQHTNQVIELQNAFQKAAILANKRVEELKANGLKRDKIKDLKKKAIIAKVLELTQLENVPYIIDDSFTTKIVVFIRLSETVRLEVTVPYNNYQIVLQNTQAAIQAVREFADKGIAINIRTSGATTPFYKWQKPN
jgi:hypothetical protein